MLWASLLLTWVKSKLAWLTKILTASACSGVHVWPLKAITERTSIAKVDVALLSASRGHFSSSDGLDVKFL